MQRAARCVRPLARQISVTLEESVARRAVGCTRSLSSAATSSSKGPVSFMSLGATMATGAGLYYWFQQQQDKKMEAAKSTTTVVGAAAIGGPFQLVDQHGKAFGDRDLLGRWSLLYFGFTRCPDICPEELEKIVEAKRAAEKSTGRKINVAFISVDPERDTVAQVGEYVKEFDPEMIGLTGTLEQTNAAARAYRVYHSKTGGEKDYLVDHSIITYLLDPEGQFITFYGKNMTAEEVTQSLVKYIGKS